MNPEHVRRLLEDVRDGDLSVEAAAARLKALPFADLDFAKVDHHRALRQGHPEIVYAPGKTPEQAGAIARDLFDRHGRVLVTRVEPAQAEAVQAAVPATRFDPLARTVAAIPEGHAVREGIVIVSAGTADQAVAGEARVVCEYLGERPRLIADVGVAGIHRLLCHAEALQQARVVIAVAGMEGALASAVAGLVGVPVVALPTSVGYGTGAGGIAALLSMLNTCAANVACVNIDNGVGAAVVASLVNRA